MRVRALQAEGTTGAMAGKQETENAYKEQRLNLTERIKN